MELNRLVLCTSGLALSLALTGCPDKRPGATKVFKDLPGRATSQPAAGGPRRGPMQRGPFQSGGATGAIEKNVPMPLNLQGHNSLATMREEQSRLHDHDGERQKYERAYRLTFTSDRSKRRQGEARRLYQEIIASHPDYGPAYRGVAYTFVDDGFQVQKAIEWYRKGVEADPSYGLAHYGLAFMLAPMGQAEEGYRHFQKAMELGVKDERNLKTKFFKNFNEGIRTH